VCFGWGRGQRNIGLRCLRGPTSKSTGKEDKGVQKNKKPTTGKGPGGGGKGKAKGEKKRGDAGAGEKRAQRNIHLKAGKGENREEGEENKGTRLGG